MVARVRRLAGQKRVGHAGTLDPDATGVLLVCLGTATRLAEYLADAGKAYQSVLALGAATTTEDASGEILTEADASHITEADLRAVLPRFVGDIAQIPPMVSAVHHEGRRLYELARAGQTVERPARPIFIESIALRGFAPGPRATATLDVVCGKGTYIRTLCADIGAALGVGGHMKSLVRTQVGAFPLETSVALETLTLENLPSHLTPPAVALADLPAHVLTSGQRDDILHGRAVAAELAAAPVVRVLSAAGDLLALARAEGGTLRPFKVFADQ